MPNCKACSKSGDPIQNRIADNAKMTLILFHGIIGDPNFKKHSKLFRFQLMLPQHDLDILCRLPGSTEQDRWMVYRALYNRTIMPAVMPLREWPCVAGCRKKATTAGNFSKFAYGKDADEHSRYTSLHTVWSLMIPYCGRDACVVKSQAAAKRYEMSGKEEQEIQASSAQGCLPTWRKEGMNRKDGTNVIWG